jgi:aspartate aminotransferase-like enzyme
LALHAALSLVNEEGLVSRIERHRKTAEAVRRAVSEWGLSLFPQIDRFHAYSNTLTAISYPAGLQDAEVRGTARSLGIEIAGGQDHLKGRIFRIGHMGAVQAPEILATLSAVQYALRKGGYHPRGDGVMAASEVLE